MSDAQQSPQEELANSLSHGFGLLATILATPILVNSAAHHNKPWGVVGVSVFVLSSVFLYLTSTLYHAMPHGRSKQTLRTVEHCAIFCLIAGTYTPVTLVAMRGIWGWSLFILAWFLATIGILLKSTVRTKHRWLPPLLYLSMAWIIIVAIRPLAANMPLEGMMWLLAGGLAYSAGLGFFAAKSVPYGHFIWHLFVLIGTACHYFAVWAYIV